MFRKLLLALVQKDCYAFRAEGVGRSSLFVLLHQGGYGLGRVIEAYPTRVIHDRAVQERISNAAQRDENRHSRSSGRKRAHRPDEQWVLDEIAGALGHEVCMVGDQ